MLNPVKSASNELYRLLSGAVERIVSEGKVPEIENALSGSNGIPDFNIEIPNDKSHGDFAANAALVCAKPFKMPPRAIAEKILQVIDLEGSSFDRAEIAGPGFINFFLSRDWFSSVLKDIVKEPSVYGRTDTGKGKSVIVEFVSANPTGPMHIGNARGGALGDCLSSVLDWAGYDVFREFYVNDAGNQVIKFGKSLDLRYSQICSGFGIELMKEYGDNGSFSQAVYEDTEKFPMPEDVYLGADIILHAKNYYDINGSALMSETEENRQSALCGYALPINIDKLESDLLKYRIKYDGWFRESILHAENIHGENPQSQVDGIIALMKKSGYTYEQDGALWFKSSALGDEKDRVLVRANGVPTYFVPDIAYHYNKLVTRGFDKAVNILGADHHGYVPRMKAALKALGICEERLDIIIMQMVRLVKGGEAYKLSKRSGKAVTLETLLDEIPVDAARFFFNLREANSHFEFDLDIAIEQSSKNPVYYVQYAHARICTMLRKFSDEGVEVIETSGSGLSVFDSPEEIELIRHLASFPNAVDFAARDYDPSRITRYSTELASLFHKFYDKCRIKGEREDVMNARLTLCLAVKTVLKNALDILKIECPERM